MRVFEQLCLVFVATILFGYSYCKIYDKYEGPLV